MKIEVGRTYVDRQGAQITITGPNPDAWSRDTYPWVGRAVHGEYTDTYTDCGSFDGGTNIQYDLVAEVPAEAEPPSEPECDDLTCQGACGLPYDHGATVAARDEWRAGRSPLPKDSDARKRIPLCTGLLDYFPAALAAVATHSLESNEKHNPGEPMHWARGKSMDHPDCILRHLVDARAALDPRYHLTALAWRALALLQEELEGHGAPVPPGAR